MRAATVVPTSNPGQPTTPLSEQNFSHHEFAGILIVGRLQEAESLLADLLGPVVHLMA